MNKKTKVYQGTYDITYMNRQTNLPGLQRIKTKSYHVELYRDNKLTGFFTFDTMSDAKEFEKEWRHL